MNKSVEPLVKKYMNEAEKFTSFQTWILAWYTDIPLKNVNHQQAIAALSKRYRDMFTGSFGGVPSDAVLKKEMEDLFSKKLIQVKNNVFSLTPAGEKTEPSEGRRKFLKRPTGPAADYGKGPGSWTGD